MKGLLKILASLLVLSIIPRLVYSQSFGEGFGIAQSTSLPAPLCVGGQLPTIRNVGTVAAATTAVSPGLPASTAAGDLLLMFCENANDGNLTASGWTDVPGTPITGATGTRITVLYKVAAGGDATTTNDSGNHQVCRIIGITTGTYCSADIWGESNSNTQTTTTSVSISGVTTSIDNGLVFQASAGDLPDADGTTQFASAANADLGSVTERIDNTTSAGTGGTGGGALFVMSGTKVTAGTVGAGTTTATNTAVRANTTIVIQGAA